MYFRRRRATNVSLAKPCDNRDTVIKITTPGTPWLQWHATSCSDSTTLPFRSKWKGVLPVQVYIYIYITDTIFWGSNASLRMMTMSFWYKSVAARLMNNTGIRKFRTRKLTGSNYDSKTERYDWGIAMPLSVRSHKNQDSSVHYNKTMQPTSFPVQHLHPFYIFQTYFLQIHFNITLPPTLRYSGWFIFFRLTELNLYVFTSGRAIIQAFSRQALTAEARVCARVNPYGICGGQSGNGTGFSPISSVFSCQYIIPPSLSTLI
jgi:hypothetical protein